MFLVMNRSQCDLPAGTTLGAWRWWIHVGWATWMNHRGQYIVDDVGEMEEGTGGGGGAAWRGSGGGAAGWGGDEAEAEAVLLPARSWSGDFFRFLRESV